MDAAVDLAIVMALSAERAGLQRALARSPAAVTVFQSGPGAVRAGEAARTAIRAGASAVLSWGIAGGLEPQLAPGTVVVPRYVALADGSRLAVEPRWQSALAARLRPRFALREGDLLSVDHVLESPRAKARAALDTGSVAADMESAAIARAAFEAGVPFAAVRVVADSLIDTLPPNVAEWIDPDGRQRITPVFGAMLRPASWPMLAVLAARYRVARRILAALAAQLAPAGFDSVPRMHT